MSAARRSAGVGRGVVIGSTTTAPIQGVCYTSKEYGYLGRYSYYAKGYHWFIAQNSSYVSQVDGTVFTVVKCLPEYDPYEQAGYWGSSGRGGTGKKKSGSSGFGGFGTGKTTGKWGKFRRSTRRSRSRMNRRGGTRRRS